MKLKFTAIYTLSLHPHIQKGSLNTCMPLPKEKRRKNVRLNEKQLRKQIQSKWKPNTEEREMKTSKRDTEKRSEKIQRIKRKPHKQTCRKFAFKNSSL